jgi:hypothetical protein
LPGRKRYFAVGGPGIEHDGRDGHLAERMRAWRPTPGRRGRRSGGRYRAICRRRIFSSGSSRDDLAGALGGGDNPERPRGGAAQGGETRGDAHIVAFIRRGKRWDHAWMDERVLSRDESNGSRGIKVKDLLG